MPAPPNAGPVGRFLLYERAYPDSVAASVDAVHDALLTPTQARAPPSRSCASAAWAPTWSSARAPPRTAARTSAQTCELVQAELALVDRDIAERYFAGAAAAGTGRHVNFASTT